MAFKGKNGTVASALHTTSGNSGALPITELGGQLIVFVDTTAVSGASASMATTVEWSHDGTTFFKSDPADAFTAITAVGSACKIFTVKAPFYRVVWVLTGTSPNFTFQTHEYVTSL